jgi:putative transposase
MLARKSIKQSYSPSPQVLSLMQEYRRMTNDAIRIGIANDNLSNMKKLCTLSYKELKIRYRNVPSCYKLCAISKAAGILASKKKSIKRGYPTKDPYVKRPLLVSCYQFRILNGKLRFPITNNKKYEFIPLNNHILKILQSDKSLVVRSITLTRTSLSLCVAKEVPEIPINEVKSTIGIDRNLRNLAVGHNSGIIYYDMSRIVKIGETTKDIVGSFKRNDARIRIAIASKYGRRKKQRIRDLLNKISKDVVERALERKSAIIFEDIDNIRSMYQKGNFQGRNYRRQMNNNWQFGEIKRQIEYKAQWAGIPVIHLTKSETGGTSSICYICGERLQSSREKNRQLWCKKCRKWFDRDLIAVINISRRGWLRLSQSKGIGSETMNGNPQTTMAILRVDPMKLAHQPKELTEPLVISDKQPKATKGE